MQTSAPYVMLPGSRLYIGPHGKPYESLGRRAPVACCGSCGRCEPMGAIDATTGLFLSVGALGLLAYIFRKK